MMRRTFGRGLIGAFSGLAVLTLSGCGLFADKHTYRYRLTVEVDTPQGVRSGSSVIEATAWESSGLGEFRGHYTKLLTSPLKRRG
jgi:hypothetical protein